MLKNMTLNLAMRYSNCTKDPRANNIFGVGPLLRDDIEIFKYRKIRIHLYFISKESQKHGVSAIFMSPRLRKREKKKNHYKSRNRIYTRANMNLLERRRFIKECNKTSVNGGVL